MTTVPDRYRRQVALIKEAHEDRAPLTKRQHLEDSLNYMILTDIAHQDCEETNDHFMSREEIIELARLATRDWRKG